MSAKGVLAEERKKEQKMDRRRSIAVGAVLLSLVGAAACSRTSDGGSADPGKPYKVQVPRGIAGNLAADERSLMRYETALGKYVRVEGTAAAYTPDFDRQVPAGTVLAFGDGQASVPFAAAIVRALRPLARNMGFDLAYCDLDLKPEKALSCAHELVAQRPTVAVIENWQSSVAKQMMDIYNDAKVPVITVDLPHPNAVYFGVDSFQSGLAAGKAAGAYAKRSWDCKDVWIYLAINPAEGETVGLRAKGYAAGIQSVCGTVPKDRIAEVVMDQASQEQALSKTTDWLTSKPQAKHILATSVDQIEPGIARAFTQNHRDGWVLQQACDDNAVSAIKKGQTDATHWIGCVAYRPDLYPQYFLSLAADVAAGKAVPNEVHFDLKFYDHDTVGELR